MTDYTALRGIQAPGTSVYGYQRGDRVHESVVANWGLSVGSGVDHDVIEGTELPADDAAVVLPEPGPESTRAEWEAYAVAGGMKEQDAAEASIEDLQDAPGPVKEDDPATSTRPADSAKKADWQAYAKSIGADETWAYADSTTKADLQAYEAPAPGDTIAVSATEANGQPTGQA